MRVSQLPGCTLGSRPAKRAGLRHAPRPGTGCFSVWNVGPCQPNIHLINLYFYILDNTRHSFLSVPIAIQLLCVGVGWGNYR